jgi:hypothetical protein
MGKYIKMASTDRVKRTFDQAVDTMRGNEFDDENDRKDRKAFF